MKTDKHRKCKRQFVITSQAWYGDSCKFKEGEAEIMVGMYHPDGGTTGEFSIKWIMLGGKSTPYLKSYNDSWSALQEFSDFLEELAQLDGTDPSVDVVMAVLLKCGVHDATERTNPRSKNPGSVADVEYQAKAYQVTLKAYELLREAAREQSNSPRWAEYAEFGVPAKRLATGGQVVQQQVLDMARMLVTQREAFLDLVRSMGDASFEEKYHDILKVPTGIK